jgi:DNA topoisomerase VI subunit B
MNMDKLLARTPFTTSRQLEFFTEQELAMQIGHDRPLWAAAVLKELIDNGLDACENSADRPHIEVIVEEDEFSVKDNGPGLPVETLKRSLDYNVRISDKVNYVSPTRGRLGNALKCLWAAPFVVDGRHGRVEVAARKTLHRVDVTLDAIGQAPKIDRTEEKSIVKTGTFFRVHWPEAASYLDPQKNPDLYNANQLLRGYATFNPHASFHLQTGGETLDLAATDRRWNKWRPDCPTSPHWYTPAAFQGLIAAYLAEERRGGPTRTVREFVAEFDGLTGSVKQKSVLAQAKLSGARLSDLSDGDEIDSTATGRLLRVMQEHTRPVLPSRLGMVGEKHLGACLERYFGADPSTVRYKKKVGLDGGAPFVLEVAFGIKAEGCAAPERDLVIGLNWSPVLGQPLHQLSALLAEMRVDTWDPVVVGVHLAYPRLQTTDRGKSRYQLGEATLDALTNCVRLSTQDWRKAKLRADRNGRLARQDVEAERRRHERGRRLRIKEAAYTVMEQAYLKASDPDVYATDGRRLPAEARQIMYAARPSVLELTGGEVWKKSEYFTQHLLPDYVEKYSEQTAGWDVVFAARGSLEEPHTRRRIPLGTVAVREYIEDWRDDIPETVGPISVGSLCPTSGPGNRYQFALFVEKQGFDALLAAGNIAARYDLALMSTKGMSVTAARRLVEELSERRVTVLVLRDFDKTGFSIVHTLRSDTRRYKFRTRPRVVDLGLRLRDARAMGLQSEQVRYKTKKDPRVRLRECGATQEECDFLVEGGAPGNWVGKRVELNAMTSAPFLKYLERKLKQIGVRKVAPDGDTLAKAYRRAWREQVIQEAVDEAMARPIGDAVLPKNLAQSVRRKLKRSPIAWDQAVQEIVKHQRCRPTAG